MRLARPIDLWNGLRIMASHYALALVGVRCRLDLDEDAHPGSVAGPVLVIAVLVAFAWSSTPALQLAAICLAGTAAWARALLGRPDRVIEWRAYSAVAGVALSMAVLLPASAVALIVSAYAIAAQRRAWWCRSELAFRRRAAIESPEKARAIGDYGNALAAVGDLDGARQMYLRVRARGSAIEQAIADRNLAGLHAMLTPQERGLC